MGEVISQSEHAFMVRIPWSGRDKSHVVGEVVESDPTTEPSRAFWTNESVKALMNQTPQPEFISRCGKVRGDWRSVQVFSTPPTDLCRRCARIKTPEVRQ